MNYKLQFSPMSSTTNGHSGSSFVKTPPFAKTWSARLEDAKFFRSWLVYDSDLDATRTRGRFNWNVILGLVLMAAVSAGGWYCVDLLVQHFLK